MRNPRIVRPWLALAFVLVAFPACSVRGTGPYRMHHAGAVAAPGPQGQHASHGKDMGHEDMKAMCSAVRDRLRSARSANERALIMQEHMRGLHPDLRHKMHENMGSRTDEERAQLCMQP